MATEIGASSITLPVAMATVIRQYRIVIVNAQGQAAEANGTSTNIVGVSRTASTNTQDNAIAVTKLDGSVIKVTAGAAFAAGATVTSDAQGRAIAATTADQRIVGIALEAATSAGEVCSIVGGVTGRR